MANGRVHAKVGWVVAGATLLASPYLYSIDPQLAAGALFGSMLGILISPDLDHERCTHDQQRVYKYLGFLPGRFYEWFWRAYERRYAHRGISHKPIIGTFTRWRYILIRFLPLVILLAPWWIDFFPAILIAFAFHALQDVVHLAFDGWKYYNE